MAKRGNDVVTGSWSRTADHEAESQTSEDRLAPMAADSGPAGPNVRRTSPVRGLGPNDVDLRGTRSPCAAIWMTASNEGGLQITAVAPGAGAPRAPHRPRHD